MRQAPEMMSGNPVGWYSYRTSQRSHVSAGRPSTKHTNTPTHEYACGSAYRKMERQADGETDDAGKAQQTEYESPPMPPRPVSPKCNDR